MVEFSAPYGVALVRHDNHSPGATFTIRQLVQPSTVLLIRNVDGNDSIQISFDGTNGFTLGPGEAMVFKFKGLNDYYTKKVSGSPAVEVLLGGDR